MPPLGSSAWVPPLWRLCGVRVLLLPRAGLGGTSRGHRPGSGATAQGRGPPPVPPPLRARLPPCGTGSLSKHLLPGLSLLFPTAPPRRYKSRHLNRSLYS